MKTTLNWPCTLCGSRHWPDPDSSCPLCRDDPEDTPTDDAGSLHEAAEEAIARFVHDGCSRVSAARWWDEIDAQTDKVMHPTEMAEELADMHVQACREAWQDMETIPSHYAWADACAIAGFDLVKNYQLKTKNDEN
jgi:hypothetical protein